MSFEKYMRCASKSKIEFFRNLVSTDARRIKGCGYSKGGQLSKANGIAVKGKTKGINIKMKITMLKKEGVMIQNNKIVDFKKRLHQFG